MQALSLTLDAGSKRPMYEQLYQYFVRQIHEGRLVQGEKLPSKRSLCASLGISRATVEAAYDLLTGEGYVEARPRSGYYVAEFMPFAPAAGPVEPVPLPPAGEERPGPDLSTASVDVSLFPYASWAKLNKEVVYASPALLQRGQRQGDPALREALRELLGEYRGVRCRSDQIIVGAGMEYLTDLLISLLPEGAVYALEDPGYPAMGQALAVRRRAVRYLPLDDQGLRPDALEASGADVAYITPSHQFPMGITMPASRRSRLLAWAQGAPGRYLIEDDYDSEFRYASRPIPALQSMDTQGRVIYIGTFSRSIAPSIRIAYLVLPPALLARYRALFGYQQSTVSRYEQAVMARFLAEGYYSRYLRRVGNLYRARRDALAAQLGALPGVELSGQDGGIHFLLTNRALSEPELCARALARGIRLRGLGFYCHSVAPKASTVVVGYGGLGREEIPALCAALAEAWGLHPAG